MPRWRPDGRWDWIRITRGQINNVGYREAAQVCLVRLWAFRRPMPAHADRHVDIRRASPGTIEGREIDATRMVAVQHEVAHGLWASGAQSRIAARRPIDWGDRIATDPSIRRSN
jgi:hypothetical protein